MDEKRIAKARGIDKIDMAAKKPFQILNQPEIGFIMLAGLKRKILNEEINIAARGVERAVRGRPENLQSQDAVAATHRSKLLALFVDNGDLVHS